MAYTKLHQSILRSTVWLEPNPTRIVWITLLALADKHGEVSGSVPGLAATARVTLAECEAAIATFLGPDPYSRTPDDEGRRIEAIAGGWQILNYDKYRLEASKDDQRAKTADRVRRFRERQRSGNVTDPALQKGVGNGPVTHDRDIAEAEADSDSESRVVSTTESLQESSRANRARARSRTARPTTVNGGHRNPTQQPVPSDWRPSKEAQARLRKAVPWITAEIAELRLIEFHGWTAGKIFPPNKLDDVWLGFMVKTDRSKYPTAAAQGWNG